MRNLKNFNHWITEIRDLAIHNKVSNYDEDTKQQQLMTISDIKRVFNKNAYEDDFKDGLTPEDAFENTMDGWRDTVID
jgi:hypothetical protein